MKKVFENLKVKENDKVTDKALTFNLAAAVIGIILCLASLTAATWAWFGDSVSSASNTVKTGIYSLSVIIEDADAAPVTKSGDPEGKEFYDLEAGKRYKITLTGEGSVSVGYCILKHGETELYTEQIYTEATDNTPKSISFYITAETDTRLYISSSWGKYGGSPDIEADGDYTLFAAHAKAEVTTE